MRQKLRKTLIFISFLFFPITMFYLSPVLIIVGAGKGIIVGSFVIFAALFVTSLFLGRGFCSWACPGGGLQECAQIAVDKHARNGRYNLVKFFIWVPWVSAIILLFILAGGLKEVNITYQTIHGISIASPQAYIVYYGFIALIVILSLASGRRAFCHYVCWMAPFMMIGCKLRNIIHLPSLRLKIDNEECSDCKRCTRNCQMSLDVNEMVSNGKIDSSECILCGECVDGCKKGCISFTMA